MVQRALTSVVLSTSRYSTLAREIHRHLSQIEYKSIIACLYNRRSLRSAIMLRDCVHGSPESFAINTLISFFLTKISKFPDRDERCIPKVFLYTICDIPISIHNPQCLHRSRNITCMYVRATFVAITHNVPDLLSYAHRYQKPQIPCPRFHSSLRGCSNKAARTLFSGRCRGIYISFIARR